MQRTKVATLVTLGKVIEKYKSNWCYASQNTLLNLLEKHQNILIHRRMLNYHLADLRIENLIKTVRRNKRLEDGTLCLLSSATCLTLKGAYLLYKMGSLWALRHLKRLKGKYGPDPDKKAKRPKSPTHQVETYNQVEPSKNPFLDKKCRKKMGLPDIPSFQKDPIPQN